MSLLNKEIFASPEITNFYINKLNDFGDSSQGVGWRDDSAQSIRFAQLIKVIQNKNNFSINDLGCGSGKLYKYLLSENCNPSPYHGYDILMDMIHSAETSLLP